MTRLPRFPAALVAAMTLAGCATGARPSAMVVRDDQAPTARRFTIVVDSVTGGRTTNPAGTSQVSDEAMAEAMRASITKAGFGNASGDTAHLSLSLQELDSPGIPGHGVHVRTSVRYRLFVAGGGTRLLDSTITTGSTAPLRRSLWGPTRRRLAIESALQENFSRFFGAIRVMELAKPD